MPIYSYACPVCARKQDIIKTIAEIDRQEDCRHCGFAMNRQITAAMVQGDYEAYDCPITGERIEGRKAHEANLRKHGCRVLEPGETEGYKRALASENSAVESQIEETAAQFVTNLPAEKKEQLACELDKGLDLAVTRN